MYNFPEIKTDRSVKERFNKVLEEMIEFTESRSKVCQDQEAIDIWHSVETFIRGYFCGREDELNEAISEVIAKNDKRGYYTNCH